MIAPNNQLNINGIPFQWGMLFRDALEMFPYENIFSGYSAWQHVEFECATILGLDSITCSLRGPKPDRPVMQASFELKPIRKKLFESHHDPYLSRLKKLFGKPHGISQSKIPNGLKYNEGYAEGMVIYNCKWWFGDVLVSLSVFGGIRSGSHGDCAAGLYFDWMNEERAAEPFMPQFLEREKALLQHMSEKMNVLTEIGQRAYHRSHYELDEPDLALRNPHLRASQLALYADHLFRFPPLISAETADREAGIFYSVEQEVHCVYNKWDFTPVTAESELEFLHILPARGGGEKRLTINSLVLNDEESSDSLDRIKAKIEELCGVAFKCVTAYND